MLSVITVNWNNSRGLERTLVSVGAQTAVELESIVIDGASSDSSVRVVDQYSATASHPLTLISEIDAGMYDAMNKGLALAKGDFVLFLNSGDSFVGPHAADIALRHMEDSGASWGYGAVNFVNLDGTMAKTYRFDPFRLWKLAYGVRTIPHQAAFFRTGFARGLGGYDLRAGVAADQEFMYRASLRSCPEVWPEVVALFELGGRGSSRPPGDLAIDFERFRWKAGAVSFRLSTVDHAFTRIVVVTQRVRHSVYLFRTRFGARLE